MISYLSLLRSATEFYFEQEYHFDYFKNKGYSFQLVDIGLLDISSSMIRMYLQNNQDIAGLVSREVKEYIENNRLYTKMAGREFIS